ncbi:NDP-sugar synthase [Alicyclobacillus cycloheptanicus]|uniref:Mannose-1-phosphate guanylyltransferase/phosphomannomutase n=1 Tax=Alicyclobacillus cycloheptanicus TaxID=1457 RepID=A0ABT9XLN2_9BACL|nr:NDP-sugar synthase [Alicyclobacillus cycloheptanicus]MDQ0191217.1 mannose-1-phosphate guanylyltransferase/phosphomannomutase [Alicyclobacillus cycloheptanicus]WDM02127.1 NDP-sugar synthase [Alicyclobacillus cycloheptanicus]
MKAVIMAGGRGSRLLPLTKHLPKPMVPLLDRPVMEYIVELLATHGFRDIGVTLGYMPDPIRFHFGDGRKFGVHITYKEEPTPLGTAGGVKHIAHDYRETFVVMSGDALTDMNLTAALAAHRRSGAWATLVLSRVSCPRGYGVVSLQRDGAGRDGILRDGASRDGASRDGGLPDGAMRDGAIAEFIEKPQTWDEGRTYTVNTGVYILEPRILDYIPSDQPYDFGSQLFPRLLDMGAPLYGHVMDGYWSDIGTLLQYYQSQLDMIHGRVQVRLPTEIMEKLGVAEGLAEGASGA